MSVRLSPFRSGLCGWLLAVAMPVFGQTPAPPPPLSAEQIVERADADERLAVTALQLANAPDPTVALSDPLVKIAESVDTRTVEFPPSRLQTLPIMRLESLARHWSFDRRRFEEWRTRFRDARRGYLDDASLIAQRRADWAGGAAGPALQQPALAARVAEVNAQLGAADTALSAAMSRQMALGQQANAVDVRLQQGEDAATAAIARIDAQLWHLDAPPLWRAQAAGPQGPGTADVIGSSLQIEADFAGAYSAQPGPARTLLTVVQVLLLPALLWLARRHRAVVQQGEMGDTAARVLGRPWSAWILLSVAAVLVLEPDAPLLVRQAAMLIALVPVLRLLTAEQRRVLDAWPYVATALYLAASGGALLMGSVRVYRWFNLVLAAVAIAATLWLLWRATRAGHPLQQRRLGQWLRAAAWLAVGLLSLSLLCNIVGNVSLAEMLVNGVVYSGYFGLLLHVMVNVVTTLLQVLLGRPGPSRFRLGREHAPPLLLWLYSVTVAAAVIGWFLYAMESFRILRPVYAMARTVLGHEFSLGSFSLSLGHILLFVAATVIAFWAAKITRMLLHEVAGSRLKLQRGTANSVAALAYYGVLLLGLIGAMSVAGFKATQLALIFGALGVGIGFGLQNVVSNFVSGLILMFERPVQPGDVIEVESTTGTVREIGLRATRVRTFDGSDVMVPNSALVSNPLVNWTLHDSNRRLEATVGVAYGSDPAHVSALLEQAAVSTPGIASAPAVQVLFTGFGASSLDFQVRAWTSDVDNLARIRSDLHARIHHVLTEAGVEIPFPQQDVHIRTMPPAP